MCARNPASNLLLPADRDIPDLAGLESDRCDVVATGEILRLSVEDFTKNGDRLVEP